MRGRLPFLALGMLAILITSCLLAYGFMSYEDASIVTIEIDTTDDYLDGAGGAAMGIPSESDSGFSFDFFYDQDTETLFIEKKVDLPWEITIVGFIIGTTMLLVVGFARLSYDDVLDGIRGDIYEFISENPGEHLAGITRQFGISSSSARHHLDVLEWSDKIVSYRSGKQKHFYPNRNGYRIYTGGFEYKQIMAVLKNDTAREMVKYLLSNDGANQKSVAEAMDMHPSTVNWHAKRLLEAGILNRSKDGKDLNYHVNGELDLGKVISLIEGASSPLT